VVAFGLIMLLLVWGGLTLGPATAAWLWVRFSLPGGESGCAACGYDLSGTPENERCPECGIKTADAHAMLPESPPLRRYLNVALMASLPNISLGLLLLSADHWSIGGSILMGVLTPVLAFAPTLYFRSKLSDTRPTVVQAIDSAIWGGITIGGLASLPLMALAGADGLTIVVLLVYCSTAGIGWGLLFASSRIVRDAKARRREGEARAVGSAHG